MASTVSLRVSPGRAMAEPLPELYELEPDDVHLLKRL
jgi:hypothetical protein